jgi:hypothetical protein
MHVVNGETAILVLGGDARANLKSEQKRGIVGELLQENAHLHVRKRVNLLQARTAPASEAVS